MRRLQHLFRQNLRQHPGQLPQHLTDRSTLGAGFCAGMGLAVLIGMVGSAIPLLAIPPIDPELVYSVTGCEDAALPTGQPQRTAAQPLRCKANASPDRLGFVGGEPVRNITVGSDGSKLTFSHALTYTCCASIVLDRAIDRTTSTPTITIVERDMGDHCRCLCDYQVAGAIGPLSPGPYTLRVYGEFSGHGSRVLLFERSATLAGQRTDPKTSIRP